MMTGCTISQMQSMAFDINVKCSLKYDEEAGKREGERTITDRSANTPFSTQYDTIWKMVDFKSEIVNLENSTSAYMMVNAFELRV